MTVPSEEVLGSRSVAPPITSTVSPTCPNCSETGTATERSTSTMILSWRNVLNPPTVASSV